MTGQTSLSAGGQHQKHVHHQRRHHASHQSQQHGHCLTTSGGGQQHIHNKQREKHTIHWFRKGLRLHDNPAFARGVRGSTTFRCVFIIDPWFAFAGSSNVGINKWRFLLQCLEDLDRSLKKLNTRLFVIRGQPADALPKLFKKWGTTCLSFEEDPEPFGKVRDRNIQQLCSEVGVDVIKIASHTLYTLENIIARNGGVAPTNYNQFQKIIESMGAPAMPDPMLSADHLCNSRTPTSEDHNEKYGVPSLLELGFDTENLMTPVWIGGETEALLRLDRHLERKAWVASFDKPKMTPQSLMASRAGLSPYLRFGCLSTRLFYHQLNELYKKIKKATPPLSLHGQLLWREFFYCAATNNSNFDRMKQNNVCMQIPWKHNPTALTKWANGQTGFPWIDAIMVQLRTEGWIHQLARHAVVSFLTRGDLWISWEDGMKVFAELLLDADWTVNAGSWMWLSGSSFFQQFFSVYCPVMFGRKVDPNGDYIRRYLPVLKDFPVAYVHEPWNCPEDIQRMSNCIIGRDYPMPMVDHESASQLNAERMTTIYKQLQKNDNTFMGNSNNIAAGFSQQANYHSPSPNTMMASMNNSGPYLCQTKPSNEFLIEPSATSANTHQHHQQQHQSHQLQQQQLSQHQLEANSGGLTNLGQHQSSVFDQIDTSTTNLNNQMMYNNESNYSSLMRHLYNNDGQNLPNIECGSDMFAGNASIGKSDEDPMAENRNDCQFHGEPNSTHFMMTADDTHQPPTTGMVPDFYDQAPFETGVESNDTMQQQHKVQHQDTNNAVQGSHHQQHHLINHPQHHLHHHHHELRTQGIMHQTNEEMPTENNNDCSTATIGQNLGGNDMD